MPLIFTIFAPHLSFSSSTTSPYTSISSLDKYGSSPQLRNALLASTRHGNLILTASTANAVISVAPRFISSNIKRNPSLNRMINIISRDDAPGGDTTAIICSGLKADADLLIKILREYGRRVWERYDRTPGHDTVSNILSEVLLSFMGYESVDMDGVGDMILESMGRPFGVQSLVVSVGKNGVGMRSVSPSGVQMEWRAIAMGKGADEANRILEEKMKEKAIGENEVEVKETLLMVLRECLDKEHGSEKTKSMEVVCEILSSDGVNIKLAPFRV